MSTGQRTMPKSATVPQVVAEAESVVSEYPLSSVLVVFGVGIGVGVALTSILSESFMPPPTFSQRTELVAEKLGRQILDAIGGVLPNSLSKHL